MGGFSRQNDFENGELDRPDNHERLINNIFGNNEELLDPLDQELLLDQEDPEGISPEQKQFYAVNRD